MLLSSRRSSLVASGWCAALLGFAAALAASDGSLSTRLRRFYAYWTSDSPLPPRGSLRWMFEVALILSIFDDAYREHVQSIRLRNDTCQRTHAFCRHCGVASFYVPRSHPDRIDVNVRCLDDVDLGTLHIERFDGRNWERSVATLEV